MKTNGLLEDCSGSGGSIGCADIPEMSPPAVVRVP